MMMIILLVGLAELRGRRSHTLHHQNRQTAPRNMNKWLQSGTRDECEMMLNSSTLKAEMSTSRQTVESWIVWEEKPFCFQVFCAIWFSLLVRHKSWKNFNSNSYPHTHNSDDQQWRPFRALKLRWNGSFGEEAEDGKVFFIVVISFSLIVWGMHTERGCCNTSIHRVKVGETVWLIFWKSEIKMLPLSRRHSDVIKDYHCEFKQTRKKERMRKLLRISSPIIDGKQGYRMKNSGNSRVWLTMHAKQVVWRGRRKCCDVMLSFHVVFPGGSRLLPSNIIMLTSKNYPIKS